MKLTLLTLILPLCSCTITRINSSTSIFIETNSSTSNNSSTSSLETGDSSSTSSSNTTPIENEDELYDALFDPTSKIEITINFSNNSIYNLAQYSINNYKADMYHPCDVNFNINGVDYFYEEVGARMKGNTSINPYFVSSEGYMHDLVHYKLSFSQTFDDVEDNDYYTHNWANKDERKERKNRRLGGMKKIDLKWNRNYDEPFMKQLYAYDCFKDAGVMALENNLVKVTINTENDTINAYYELQECIDSTFLEKRLPQDEAEGDLYKCRYTSMGPADLRDYSNNKIGIEDVNYKRIYELKTNEKTSDLSSMTNLIDVVNKTGSVESIKSELDNILDIDYTLRFFAVSWVLGNPDDIRNNYNNYYLYFNSKNQKAYFIPYDYDRCLGILNGWPINLADTPWYTTKTNLEYRDWQNNPLIWRLLITSTDTNSKALDYPVIEEYRNRYYEYCVEYANKYLDVNRFKELADKLYYSNGDISHAGDDNMTFEEYCTRKLATFNL